MAFLDIDPKRFAFLLTQGIHEGELKKFFVESRLQLLVKGAKVQNLPHGREKRIKTICERLPSRADEVLRTWFQNNVSVADPVSLDEVLLYLGAYFDEDEQLPEAEAQVICRSALVYLFGDGPNAEFLHLLRGPRDSQRRGAVNVQLSDDDGANLPSEPPYDPTSPIDPTGSMNNAQPAHFQIAELLASVISGDENSIDNALEPFADRTQLLVEALLRLREGDVDAAKEKLELLGDHEPESELVRSALARSLHHRDASDTPIGIRTVIAQPLDEDPHTDTYEIVGIYTNETDTGAVFVKPLFLVLEGRLRQLTDGARARLFPDSGSVMTHRSVLHRQLRRRELVHWTVLEREGAEGKTRFHLEAELGPLIEAVRIPVPSNDADEVRNRIKRYAAGAHRQSGPQVMFLLADGVAVVSPKGVDFARDAAFESPWQSWGSLETWLIEGHEYCLEALQATGSQLDLSPLDVAFRKLLKNLDAEQRLTITKAQRAELSAWLRGQSGDEIALRAKRIASSIDQLSISEEDLDEILSILGARDEIDRRVSELVAVEYEKRQAEKSGLLREISVLREKKSELEKEGRQIERVNRDRGKSTTASVQEAFAKAVQEGVSTLANAEIFRVLTSTAGTTSWHESSVLDSKKVKSWIKQGALSKTDVEARLFGLGINRRRAFILTKLSDLAAASGVALTLKGGVARQCVQTLVRQDRDPTAIIDIPMGLTSCDFLKEALTNLAEIKGMALINADLSPLEIYGAELIDLLVEQAMVGVSNPLPILLSCMGGDFSLPLPQSLRRVSLIIDLNSAWEGDQKRMDQIEADLSILLPTMREKLSNAISAMDDDDRRHIESVLVNSLLIE